MHPVLRLLQRATQSERRRSKPRPNAFLFSQHRQAVCEKLEDRRLLSATVWYVDHNAVGGLQTGTSWANAFLNPVQALSAAQASDEIWVADGTYTPTTGTDRSVSFQLRDGIGLYGGFSGIETTRDQRNWGANPTILSGDIGAPGSTDNSAHVLYGWGNNVVVDGFTVADANSNLGSDYFDKVGGGIRWCGGTLLTLRNVAFVRNHADSAGGAGFFSAPAKMINCVIAENTSPGTGAAVDSHSQLDLINCTIVRNRGSLTIHSRTGGLIAVTNCIVWGNTVDPGYVNNFGTCPNASLSLQYTDADDFDGFTGSGNLSVDPKFVNIASPAGADGRFGSDDDGLQLGAGSPAVNVGSNASLPAGVTTDFARKNRVQNGQVDMGAYESAWHALVVTTTATPLSYPTNSGALSVDPGMVVTDVGIANLVGATVRIAGNYAAGQDVLGFAPQNGITGSWSAPTATLTLTGISSVANYQAALRSVTYTNTSTNPSTLTRTVTFTANDGTLTSVPASRSIAVASRTWGPLITFSPWGQSGMIDGTTAWNQYCPLDPTTHQRSVTGCVATAEAQLLYYWHFPHSMPFSTSSDFYTSASVDGQIKIDSDAVTYDFPSFSTLNSELATIEYDNSAIEKAMLSFATGIKAQEAYASSASSAALAKTTLDKFGFESSQISDWSAIKPTVISNIQLSQPVLVALSGSTGGHTVLLDGYNNSDDTFHVNLGWGPGSTNMNRKNNWYTLPVVDVVGGYSFSGISTVIYNIKPPSPAPDLTMAKPSGWSDKLVISTNAGDNLDDSPIYSNQSIFVDCAVTNAGAAAAGPFVTRLLVDGVPRNTWTSSSLAQGAQQTYIDFNVGTLPAGTHTLQVVTDAGSSIAESNEANNNRTRMITVVAPAAPEMSVLGGSGLNVEIVDGDLTPAATDRTDFGNVSISSAPLVYTFKIKNTGNATLSLNGNPRVTVAGGSAFTVSAQPAAASMAAGAETTFQVAFDPSGVGTNNATVAIVNNDSNENPYNFSITGYGLPASVADLTIYQPSGWTDKMVISTNTGDTIDDTGSPIYSDQNLYLDFSVGNVGGGNALASTTQVYVDGSLAASISTNALAANAQQVFLDRSIGKLSAGTHTIQLRADGPNGVTESNETNNNRTRSITVLSRGQADLTMAQPAGWSDKMIVSTNTGDNLDDSPIYADQDIFIDCAVANTGSADAGTSTTQLLVDGLPRASFATSAIAKGGQQVLLDRNIGKLTAGMHILQVRANGDGAINESNNANNNRTRMIVVRSSGSTFQAENAAISDGSISTSQSGYQGTGYVDLGGQGSLIQWNVSVGMSGRARLEFRYANGNGSVSKLSMTVSVNGVIKGKLQLPYTGGWNKWTVAGFQTDWLAGTSAIVKLTTDNSVDAPCVDWLRLTSDGTSRGALNSALDGVTPSGASSTTAGSDGLTYAGVPASETMAERDRLRVMRFKTSFETAATHYNLPPALLAAIASRETRGGGLSLPYLTNDGWGDLQNGVYHGYGLMQVDIGTVPTPNSGEGPYGLDHILEAASILGNKVQLAHQYWPGLTSVQQLLMAVSRYNGGSWSNGMNNLDTGTVGSDGIRRGATTNRDYGNDVLARAQYYARVETWNV